MLLLLNAYKNERWCEKLAEIIYRDKFYCPICKHQIEISLFGDHTFKIDENVKQEVNMWGNITTGSTITNTAPFAES